MIRRLLIAAFATVAATLAPAAPALAHGDHDARPLARQLAAGPYTISVWQVYPDSGSAMTPHVIVMFEGVTAAPAGTGVRVAVNATPMDVRPSNTTANGFETTQGVDEGDVLTVTIAAGAQEWELAPVVVPPPPTAMLPMQELIYVSIFMTAGTAWWVLRRTARAWRKPLASSPAPAPAD